MMDAGKNRQNPLILVTGANGFVGVALVRRLLTDGWSVRAAVRTPGAKRLSKKPGLEMVPVGDISGATDWQAALAGIEVVIHLAARVHVMEDRSADPLAAYRVTNVEGTRRLAQMAAAAGCRRLVFVSSIKANGEGRDQPYTEADPPQPLDPYGVSKWEAEQALAAIGRETGLETVVLRPPVVYGPGVKANILRLLQAIDRGWPLPLGSINNRRSLIYVGNLVDALVTAAFHPRAARQTYMVSDGEDVSTPELVRRMAIALNRSARLLPFPPALMRLIGRLTGKTAAVNRLLESLTVDSARIRQDLGWQPPFSMAQGLAEMVRHYMAGS